MSLKNNPTLKSSKIRVGLTIGDPAGIGPLIALKAVKRLGKKAFFTLIGDRRVLIAAAALAKISLPACEYADLPNLYGRNFKFGRSSAQSGKASLEYLDAALSLIKDRRIDCLVTCPVSKEAINLAGVKFFGHTEYLAKQTASRQIVMLLVNDKIRFSLLTRHLPLNDVCRNLKAALIKRNLLNTVTGLKKLFLIKKPKLVVCGVNPHASDNGVIGQEENKILSPVIKSLNRKFGSSVIAGPVSADVAIAQAAEGKYDCVIAAYHDQALIALKLTGFDRGVNLTLGLPFVRTSPLHGTAFDIAAHPRLVNPASLVSAIELAIKCTLNRKKA
jgi:4-hydroxythreonine-4-phosphate dehydrogenase